ncbi:MAG: YeeE/YedE thiosulfate transporter family protein [Acidimicrobiales bacterium]
MSFARRAHLTNAGFGLALGFVVSMIGFGDFGQLNAMFTFQSWRMFLAFAGGVALAAAGFLALRAPRPIPGPIHRGIVPGAVLFGAGWAMSGGCPAIPLVQLSSGYLPAAVTMSGMAVGMIACRKVFSRWIQIDRGTCSI